MLRGTKTSWDSLRNRAIPFIHDVKCICMHFQSFQMHAFSIFPHLKYLPNKAHEQKMLYADLSPGSVKHFTFSNAALTPRTIASWPLRLGHELGGLFLSLMCQSAVLQTQNLLLYSSHSTNTHTRAHAQRGIATVWLPFSSPAVVKAKQSQG